MDVDSLTLGDFDTSWLIVVPLVLTVDLAVFVTAGLDINGEVVVDASEL